MKIKFKKGAPCPVAGMAGSDLCLGGSRDRPAESTEGEGWGTGNQAITTLLFYLIE
jgi:hypothetical protein